MHSLHTDTIYTTVIYPQITSLSASGSGALGGQRLTISGTGFNAQDCASNSVKLEGVTCAVSECTSTQIVCTVGAAPAVSPRPYASTVGLTTKLWLDSASSSLNSADSFTGDARYPSSPSVVTQTLNGLQGSGVNIADRYLQQVRRMLVCICVLFTIDREPFFFFHEHQQQQLSQAIILHACLAG